MTTVRVLRENAEEDSDLDWWNTPLETEEQNQLYMEFNESVEEVLTTETDERRHEHDDAVTTQDNHWTVKSHQPTDQEIRRAQEYGYNIHRFFKIPAAMRGHSEDHRFRRYLMALSLNYIMSKPATTGNASNHLVCTLMAKLQCGDIEDRDLERLKNNLQYRLSSMDLATQLLIDCDIPLPSDQGCRQWDHILWARECQNSHSQDDHSQDRHSQRRHHCLLLARSLKICLMRKIFRLGEAGGRLKTRA